MSDRRAPQDDELELGARPVPRWMLVTAALLALVVVVALLVANRSSGSHHEARPSASPSPSPSITMPRHRTIAASGVGAPLPIGDAAPLDVAASGRTTWVLQAGTVSVYDGATRRSRPRPIPDVGFDPATTAARLVLDPDRGRLWVLVSGSASTQAREYDADTLRPMRSMVWTTVVSSAAVLRGRLYVVSSSDGVDVLDGDRLRILLPGVRGGVIAADRSRSRLLVLPVDTAQIWAIVPGHTPVAAHVPAEVVKGTLAVTAAGRVWLAGYSSPGAVLAELDPVTFRILRRSPVAAQVGPGAILLAAGREHVFVHTGDNSAGLWCVDARTGAPDQFWPIDPVAVAVAPRNAVAISGADTLPLRLQGGCAAP